MYILQKHKVVLQSEAILHASEVEGREINKQTYFHWTFSSHDNTVLRLLFHNLSEAETLIYLYTFSEQCGNKSCTNPSLQLTATCRFRRPTHLHLYRHAPPPRLVNVRQDLVALISSRKLATLRNDSVSAFVATCAKNKALLLWV